MQTTPEIIDTQDLETLFEEQTPLFLLDVRSADELKQAAFTQPHHHIPLNELSERLDELPNNQAIVCICHHGMRSLRAAQILLDAKFSQRIYTLEGGIHAWSLVDKSVPRY